jgi:hypothetical protein
MAADGFKTIQRSMTVAEGEMFAELFRREGIDVRFHPMTGAAIGTGQQVTDLRIDVPIDAEARVRELLSELEYVGSTHDEAGAEGEAEEESDAESEPASPAMRPRRPKLAAGIAFLVPGGGHFHARRPWTGLVVASTLFCGWLSSFSLVHASFGAEMLFGALIALVLADSIGGARASTQENRGIHPDQMRQLANGFVLLACASAAGAVFATVAATPRWLQARKLARVEISCSPGALRVRNGDGDGRLVTVSNLILRTQTSGAGRGPAYRVGSDAWTQLEVAAGQSNAVEFSLPDYIRQGCVTAGCELMFYVEASRRGEDSVSVLKGQGSCVPWWDQPDGVWPGRIEPVTAAAE